LNSFEPDAGSLRITYGQPLIPHAFCISASFFGLNIVSPR
jgi:hypothetical protein